jgi:hypothetical protein
LKITAFGKNLLKKLFHAYFLKTCTFPTNFLPHSHCRFFSARLVLAWLWQTHFHMHKKRLLFLAVATLLAFVLPAQTTYNVTLKGNFVGINNTDRSCVSADGQQVLAADLMVGTDHQISLTKTDANGFVKWSYSYGDPGDEFTSAICLANDGGFIVTGTTTNYSAGINDIFVLKTDSIGTVQWYKTFSNGNHHLPMSVAQATNGNICVAGCYNVWNYTAQPMAATILILDNSGNLLSFQALNFSRNYPVFSMVRATPAGGFVFCGESGHVWDYYAVMAAQTDASGVIQWIQTYRSTTPSG